MYISILIILSLLFFTITILKYRNVYSYTNNSDQIKQVNTALEFNISSLNFSIMHQKSDKSACKEMTIFFISLISKIIKFRNKFLYSLLTLSLFHHFTVIILFFLVSSFTNEKIGLIVSIFAMLSLWSNWMVLLGSHSIIGNFFFLLSVFLIQNIDILFFDQYLIKNIFLIFFAGICSGFLVFSSPSTLKFLILIIIYIYFKLGFFDETYVEKINLVYLFLSFFLIYYLLSFKLISQKLYKFFFKKRNKLNNNYYIFFKIFFSLLVFFLFFNILMLSYIKIEKYYLIFLYFFSLSLISFLFLRGNILQNVKRYIGYLFVHFWNYHHKNSLNKELDQISVKENNFFYSIFWVLKVIFKIQPFYLLTFLSLLISFLLINFSTEYFIIIFTLLLPIFIFSYSGGPVIISAIFSSFFYNSIFVLSICLFLLTENSQYFYFYYFVYIMLFLEIVIGVYKFFFDILDADLFIYKLLLFLKKNKIKQIYTFKNSEYFGYFYNLLEENFVSQNIKLIKKNNLSKLKNKYFIIPPLNPYSIYYHSNKILHTEIYFDQGLNLIKRIRKYKKKIFNTRSSSRLFIYIGNITCFFHLYLNRIKLKHYKLGKCVIFKLK